MSMTSLPFAALTYQGSVKTVYQDCQQADTGYFAFSDAYSVFDWGAMPDTIPKKGQALSVMGGVLFQQLANPQTWQQLPFHPALSMLDASYRQALFSLPLYQHGCKAGLPNHFKGWVTPTQQAWTAHNTALEPCLMQVQRVVIPTLHPVQMETQTAYQYAFSEQLPRLIPLEVVFRFGLPQGSSLSQRLQDNPAYASALGLPSTPAENTLFSRPVVEFFTKLEPLDRLLPLSEAVLISGLSDTQFKQLYDSAQLIALWLYARFADLGVTLWDGKLEFALGPYGILLVDSIGPDELRLLLNGVHLSKEALRQHYRHTPWYAQLQRAKSEWPSEVWKQHCDAPSTLPEPLKSSISHLYQALANELAGQVVFKEAPSLQSVVKALQQQMAQPQEAVS